MHSITVWKLARRPNYNTNINHIYPYSEVPYIGEYNLVRLPLSSTNLIEHVDYWGEGKIESQAGVSGFANCYNVNHQYQLVSNGPDKDRKIPNRIPVISYTNCNTASYIKDNSVKLVTLMGAPINKSCAKDIARMVNFETGSVVVFGFEDTQADIKNLNEELPMKGLLYCHGYQLPEALQGLTLFGDNSHKAYTNITDMGEELRKRVVAGSYDSAVNLSLTLDGSGNGSVISDVVRKLLETGVKNTMEFAYKLWNSSNEIITKYFPVSFKLILKGSFVKIMGKKNFKAVKLNANPDKTAIRNTFAWCDSKDNTSSAVRWELYPIWEHDKVFFKIKNTEEKLFLKIDDNEENGQRKIWGSEDTNDLQYQWALEPFKIDDDLLFHIVDRKFNYKWKADISPESYLYGSADDKNLDDFKWFIAPWQQEQSII
ncbi:low molecular mass lipoprotein 4-like [Cydia strobilella]|uniref:low molecular mass lipoprotein 4-like n=1 Tax=Cydia strobilella TaxID=1100964 RepID=UPI003007CDA5